MPVENKSFLPAELTTKGRIEVGVEYLGTMQFDFTVGPLTAEAEILAQATMPDFIDPALIWLATLRGMIKALSDENDPAAEVRKIGVAEEQIAAAQKLSKGEINRAQKHQWAMDSHTHRFRVTRLGTIPTEDIPAAVAACTADDMKIISGKCIEVDNVEARFRTEAQKNNSRRDGALDGGDDTGTDDELVL